VILSPADLLALGYCPDASARTGRAVRLEDAPAPKRARATWAPFRSKWEMQYAGYLDVLVALGHVVSWTYEPDTLVCAGGTKYRPDFRVVFHGHEEYHEVKGYFRAKDKVRMREAAVVSALPIMLVTRKRGAWHATPFRMSAR